MSGRWETTREIELQIVDRQFEVDNNKSTELREDVAMDAAVSLITALGAVAIERTDHHWGLSSEGMMTLSGAFAVLTYKKYRQYLASKDRVFNTWRQKIELELMD